MRLGIVRVEKADVLSGFGRVRDVFSFVGFVVESFLERGILAKEFGAGEWRLFFGGVV